jgi:SAM-dependent methyltransferase
MGEHARPGASLRAFSDYFRRALVFGADVDRRVLFQDERARIRTFYVDQRDPETVAALWREPELAGEPFDIVIDDGLHEPAANLTFLAGSFARLRPGGLYLVEDVTRPHRAELEAGLRALPLDIGWAGLLSIPHPSNEYDNTVALLIRTGASS